MFAIEVMPASKQEGKAILILFPIKKTPNQSLHLDFTNQQEQELWKLSTDQHSTSPAIEVNGLNPARNIQFFKPAPQHCNKAETGLFPLPCQEERQRTRRMRAKDEACRRNPGAAQVSKRQSSVRVTQNLFYVNICCLHSPNSL